jgi:hypothetical protein
MVESPSGDDPQPSNPSGADLPGLLSQGAGFVNYYVHGCGDGFVVRSSGLLESDFSWVRTYGSPGDGHGHLNTIAPTPTPGIHLSAACDQGGFDLNSPPYNRSVGESVAERLLFTSQGGAVAFVGQSRWGWVSSSYKLIEKFYQHVKSASTPNHVGIYQALAKAAYPGYRDLVFGNNLYGDPEMPVWTSVPHSLTAAIPPVFTPGSRLGVIEVLSGSQPVSGALVTIAAGDSVWFLGTTDASGSLDSDLPMPNAGEIAVTVSKAGYRMVSETVPVSIIADVFDDDVIIPGGFALSPNYPNPFNAATVVPIALEAWTHVSLNIYDILGRRVRTLVNGSLESGPHHITFDATDNSGRPLPSGVYFARLVSDGQAHVRKMVLLR